MRKQSILFLSISLVLFVAFTAVEARSEIILERAFSTGMFTGSKDNPKELISFKFQNKSDRLLKDVSVAIKGTSPEMAEQVRKIERLEPGASGFVQIKLPAIKSDDPKNAGFSITATADGTSYQFEASLDRIPPDWKSIHLLTHFHFDPVWINKDGERGYTTLAIDLIHQYINTSRTDREYSFVLEQIAYLKPFWDHYPELRDALMKLKDRKQFDLVGGSYIQPDESSVFGEGLIRSYQYGRLFEDGVMHGNVNAGWQIDNFGHTPQLPQILQKSGITSFTFLRGGANGLPRQYFWIAPDGTDIFSFDLGMKDELGKAFEGRFKVGKKEDVNMDLIKNLEQEILPDAIGILREASSVHSFFLPIGDDFMKPQPLLSMLKRYWNGKYTYPAFRFSIPDLFFKEAFKDAAANPLKQRYIAKDLNPVSTGCYSSRTDIKIANRLAESTYLNAETFSTVAHLLGAKYPARALDKSLRELLYNEHHDSIPGTTNELSYLDILYGWRESLNLSSEVLNKSTNYIASRINTSNSRKLTPLVVFNPVSFKTSDAVEIKYQKPIAGLFTSEGSSVPFDVYKKGDSYIIRFTASGVPGIGYRVLYAETGSGAETTTEEKASRISNEFFEVEVDPSRGGAISLLKELSSGRNFAADASGQLMNSIMVYEDKGDLWDLRLSGGYSTVSAKADVRVIKGNTFSQIVSVTQNPEFSLEQRITLQAGVPRVDFETKVFRFDGADRLFKLQFPVANASGLSPVYGERFAPLVRKRGEEFPVDKWAGFSPATAISFPKGQAQLGVPAIIIQPENAKSHEFSRKLIRALITAGTPSVTFFKKSENDPTTNSAIYIGDPEDFKEFAQKLGADFNKIVHTVNRNGMALLFDNKYPLLFIGRRIYESDTAAATIIDSVIKNRKINITADMLLSTPPVDASDQFMFALINNGSNGYKFTDADTIEVQLLRSATGRPAGEAYNHFFARENWNHVFRYSVVTGGSDWESAGVESASQQFNRPMYAVWTDTHKGTLPSDEFSFFSLSSTDALISSLRIADNSIPAFKRNSKAPPVSVRFYNTTGVAKTMAFNSFVPTAASQVTDMQGNALAGAPADALSSINPREIRTVRLDISPQKNEGAEIGREFEPVQPIYSAYWRHGDNVDPLGYQPLTVSFDPWLIEKLDETEINLKVSSDYTDSSSKGSVTIEVPEGWSAEPSSTDYDFQPGGFDTKSIRIKPAAGATVGVVRALYENEGQKFYTSAIFGKDEVPQIDSPESVSLKPGMSSSIKMVIKNRAARPLSGEAVMISPIGTWEEAPGTLQLNATPFRSSFSIPASGSIPYKIMLSASGDALPGKYWVVLKLMADGNYYYSNTVDVIIEE